jgi:PIN like domain
MELDQLEADLLAQLSRTQLRTAEAAKVQSIDVNAVKLDDLTGIGVDTNILKQLRREPILADTLSARTHQLGISLIIPAQSVIEFWNNHKVFAKNDWNRISNDVNSFRKRLEGIGALTMADARIASIEATIKEIVEDLQESTAPGFLENSQRVMDTVLEHAIQPMVSRVSFAGVAHARQQCKVPPGFADESNKGSAGLGDFFAWSDFLLGALSVLNHRSATSNFVFVTDDSKPDWKTGDSGHPELLHEFRQVTGGVLAVTGFSDLRRLLKDAENAAKAAGRGTT